jgi:hypothetical protein
VYTPLLFQSRARSSSDAALDWPVGAFSAAVHLNADQAFEASLGYGSEAGGTHVAAW